jgi:hypothetical protein
MVQFVINVQLVISYKENGVIYRIKITKTRNIRTCTLIVKIGPWIRQLSVTASSGSRLNSFRCSCSGLPCLKVKKRPQHDCDKRDPIGERYMSRAIAGKRIAAQKAETLGSESRMV